MSVREDNSDDDTCDRLIAEYLDAVQRGSAPPLEKFLEDHPECRRQVEEYCSNHERLGLMAGHGLSNALFVGETSSSRDPNQTLFGDYELLEEIGRGGMGVVFRARQISLDREVAVKRISSGRLASRREVDRFRREAEAAASLDHRNIVTIFEVGEDEREHYFSMQLVEGGDLKKRIANLVRTPLDAAHVVERVCRAVHFAHQRGVLHRDLKPQNVLIDTTGEPVVTDFGLAKRVDDDRDLTRSGAVVGTPEYLAPEILDQGDAATISSDVYSLGVVLYECLTGEKPYKGSTTTTLVKEILQRDPRNPRRRNPRVHADLATICLKALEKVPAKRYSSADAFADDLQRFREGKPIEARPAGLGERTLKWARRRPALAGLILAGIVIAGLTISLSVYYRSARQAKLREAAARNETQEQRGNLLIEKIVEAMEAKNHVRAVVLAAAASADEIHSPFGDFALRRAQAAWSQTAGQMTLLWSTARGQTSAVFAIDSAGRTMALPGANFDVCVNDLRTGREIARAKGATSTITDIVFSPNGEWLAASELKGPIHVWSTASSAIHDTALVIDAEGAQKVRFSPDSRRIAFIGALGTLEMRTLSEPETVVRLANASVRSILFHPNGDQLFSGSQSGALEVRDADTAQLLGSFPGSDGPITALALDPESQSIAGTTAGGVTVWNPVNGSSRNIPFAGGIDSVCFVPNPTRLVLGARGGQIHLVDLEGSKASKTLQSTFETVSRVAFVAPMGVLVSSSWSQYEVPMEYRRKNRLEQLLLMPVLRSMPPIEQAAIEVWRLEDGRKMAQTGGHTSWVTGLAFCPDPENRVVASCSGDRTVRIFESESGIELQQLRGHDAIVSRVAFDHTGRQLYSAGFNEDRVCVWKHEEGRWHLSQTLQHGQSGNTTGFAVCADGRIALGIASGIDGGKILLWSGPDASPATLGGKMKPLTTLEFGPAGELAVGLSDGTVQEWDPRTKELVREIKTDAGWVLQLKYSPNGRWLCGAFRDRRVRAWRREDDAWDRPIDLEGHDSWVTSIAFSPDSSRLASCSRDGMVKFWDLAARKSTTEFEAHAGSVWSLAFSPDGTRLATASHDYTVKMWAVENDQKVKRLSGHTQSVYCVRFGETRTALISASDDGTVRLWNVQTGQQLAVLEHPTSVASAAISPDSTVLASGSRKGAITFWRLTWSSTGTNARKMRSFSGHAFDVTALAFAPRGELLASGGRDKTLRIWNVETGELVKELFGHTNYVKELEFLTEGKILSVAEDRTARIWDVEAGKELQVYDGHPGAIFSMAIHPGGRLFATGAGTEVPTEQVDFSIRLWDLSTGNAVGILSEQNATVRSLAFSHDGSLLAAGTLDGHVYLWDVVSLRRVGQLDEFGHVNSLRFSPDDEVLAIGSNYSTIRLWRIPRAAIEEVVPSDVLRRFQSQLRVSRSGVDAEVPEPSGRLVWE